MNEYSEISSLPMKERDMVEETDRFFATSHNRISDNSVNHSQLPAVQSGIHRDDVIQATKKPPTSIFSKFEDPKYDKTNSEIEQNKHALLSNGDHQSKPSSSGEQRKRFHSVELTKHVIIMIILNILMVITLLILFLKKSPGKVSVDSQEIITMRMGDAFGGPGGGGESDSSPFLDDAKKAELTFMDNIRSITAWSARDGKGEPLLFSFIFRYSNGKSGNRFGGSDPTQSQNNSHSLNLDVDERITQVIIYRGLRFIPNRYREPKSTSVVVGIHFRTSFNRNVTFGSTVGDFKLESPKDHYLAYVLGKHGGYVDSVRFYWYGRSTKTSPITL